MLLCAPLVCLYTWCIYAYSCVSRLHYKTFSSCRCRRSVKLSPLPTIIITVIVIIVTIIVFVITVVLVITIIGSS